MLIKDGTRKGRMKKDSLYVVLKVHKTKYSSLAQSVEHSAVNRSVVGSSPTGGVMKNISQISRCGMFFCCVNLTQLVRFFQAALKCYAFHRYGVSAT